MEDLLGYAPVSTLEQNARLQTDALKAAGCTRYRVFTDRAPGALDERPELAKLIDQARPGGTVVVWHLGRLGRSLPHMIDTVNELAERQVGFRSPTQSIDTTTSGGKLVFHIFGTLVEFERELIRERTRPRLAAARARVRYDGGWPLAMSPGKVAAEHRRMFLTGRGFPTSPVVSNQPEPFPFAKRYLVYPSAAEKWHEVTDCYVSH